MEHSKNISRYDSLLINRLHIGHSRLTHILCGDDPPTCQSCGLPVSVRHVLVECVRLRDIRTKYFTASPCLRSGHGLLFEAHFYSANTLRCLAVAVWKKDWRRGPVVQTDPPSLYCLHWGSEWNCGLSADRNRYNPPPRDWVTVEASAVITNERPDGRYEQMAGNACLITAFSAPRLCCCLRLDGPGNLSRSAA